MKNHAILERNSGMEREEREFILEIIEKYKPKKILSVGIASGANEAIILDYLEKHNLLDSIKLISADYSVLNFYGGEAKTGFLVKECVPHLEKYWEFYVPGLVANHLEKIGKGIDLCIIDTMHYAPGEALDFLMILPFLSKNAVLVLHDLITHHFDNRRVDWCYNAEFRDMNICSVLFNTWNGKKFYPKPYLYAKLTTFDLSYKDMMQNIGACVLSDNQLEDSNLESYFRILNLPWYYMPSDTDLKVASAHFKKYYGEKYATYFHEIVEIQKGWVKNYQNRGSAEEMIKIKNRISYKIDRALSKVYKKSGARAMLKSISKGFKKTKN
ncbi:hypothetical protein DCO58_07250 [Helicobacter saguini]|uniref:Class I SAM-dependent methyltransferase n=1 Tax=Helicobacter saguini TaxID=1548018 RepID=A0A347W4F1_9HELI|nr:class I SAM-dependent methyltransferase [Helicobacter saguini]MWV61871.1 hypothetical protein [Helicobacter saguini]MWV67454.1 hypothetical protein [Helicobacter saguini]MWV69806.1 hypothetical protein [Helicobacter saguini]MWV72976.1 hypothetical protein [Helicobacter saguini]TLD95643.1 class I SAM-dependent methyltransferase [Helicobacter saguini]